MEEKGTDLKPIEGGASIRKKSELQKAANSFIVEDAKTVGSTLLKEIIIPSIKGIIANLGKTAIDMFLYGKSEKPAQTTRSTYSNASYKRAYDRVEPEVTQKKTVKTSGFIEYDEFLYDSREIADRVRTELIENIAEYGQATIAEMYSFSGYKSDNPMHSSWGWLDLTSAAIKSIYDNGETKYVIKFPRPQRIKWIE